MEQKENYEFRVIETSRVSVNNQFFFHFPARKMFNEDEVFALSSDDRPGTSSSLHRSSLRASGSDSAYRSPRVEYDESEGVSDTSFASESCTSRRNGQHKGLHVCIVISINP